MVLGLKVNIDSSVGTRDGVPALLEVLAEHGVTATFFVTVGPDHWGRSIRRLFARHDVAKRTGNSAARQLACRHGVLWGRLSARANIADELGPVLRSVADAGHEVGLRGFDPAYWCDRLPRMTGAEVSSQLLLGSAAFRRIFGCAPDCSAAPGWTCSPESLRAQDELPYRYHSDTRGTGPFYPTMGGYTATRLQLPTSLPTIEEFLGGDCTVDEAVAQLGSVHLCARYNVFTLRAEVEGCYCPEAFSRLLKTWRSRGVALVPLGAFARNTQFRPESAPVCEVAWKTVPGRPGAVAVQDSVITRRTGFGSRHASWVAGR